MKTQSVVNTRLVEDKERLLLNFVFSLWFEKALEDVNNGTNKKLKKRYAQLDPFKMVVEPPVVFKDDYFYACAADRPGGTLLVDKKVPYLTLETFLDKAKVSDKVKEGDINQTLADAVKNKTVSLSLLRELIASPSNLSADPVYYLTKLYPAQEPVPSAETQAADDSQPSEGDEGDSTQEDNGDYVILFDSQTTKVDFDALVSWVFRDYTFEEIVLECVEEGDSDYPTAAPDADKPESFYTGQVTVKDSTFKEKTFTFHFVDLNLLAAVVASLIPVEPGDAEIVDVTPTAPEPIPPTAEEQVIGKGTVIETSAKVEDTDVLLSDVMDDLGNDLTDSSELIITDNSAAKVTASIKVKDMPYAYSFNYDSGERRRVTTTFKLKGKEDDGQTAVIPVSYALDDASITPVVETLDFSQGLSNATIQLSFLDKDNNPIEHVVPQTLGEGYKMFATSASLTFLGDSTDFGVRKGVTVKDLLKFNLALKAYGVVDFKFTDPALKDFSYSVVDPTSALKVDLVKITYNGDTLTLDYNLLQNEVIYETNDKKFSDYGEPKIVVNDTVYSPTTTWTKSGFSTAYVIGKGVSASNVIVRGQLSVGVNKVLVAFMNNITITPPEEIPATTATISTIVLNGSYISPGAEKITNDVGNGSLILISDANQVKANGIALTRFTDALGTDITNKVSAVFTQLSDDATQFGVNMTITDYQWPMGFDNQGSTGEFTCEFKLLGNPDSAKSEKTSYKLTYGYEGITPRPISAKLSNNSLNKASIYINFYDKYYNAFETGVEQNIAINPPLFGNSDLTYIGDKITYGADDNNHFGAYIPVNFKQFGDFSLSFADTQFKTVTGSLADPNGKYALSPYDESIVASGEYAVRFRLSKDNQAYSLFDGKVINDSIKATIDSKAATVSGIGWTPNDDTGAVLTVYVTLPEGTNKTTFDAEISGTFYVGINDVGVSVAYDTAHAEV